MQDGIDVLGGTFFSKSISVQTKIRPCRGKFFLKINKRADQKRTAVQDKIDVQGGNFLKINKRADQNKTVQGRIYLQN